MACILASGLQNWPQINTSKGPKISAICLSGGHLYLGYETGDVNVYLITKSQHLSILWSKSILETGCVDLLAYNEEETLLVVVGGQRDADRRRAGKEGVAEGREVRDGKVAVVDLLSGDVCLKTELGESISAVSCVGSSIYIGGRRGGVYRMEFRDLTLASPLTQILALDSEVVQIDGGDQLLVCSTLTRAVVVNHSNKSYREIGSKLRQGGQGVAVLRGRVWSARPGSRIWEVDKDTGNVLATRQYRKAITENNGTRVQKEKKKVLESVDPLQELDEGGEEGGRGEGSGDIAQPSPEHGFLLLHRHDHLLASYNRTGMVYLLDMLNSTVLAWTHLGTGIKQLSFHGDMVIILDQAGVIQEIRFGTLDRLMHLAHSIEKFDLCADLFIQNRKLIRTLTKRNLQSIVELKDLGSKLADSHKSSKVNKLMDAVKRLGISLDVRRLDNRSISQDRRTGFHSSTELFLKDDRRSGKSQSQEDLLDGRPPHRVPHLNRTLSGSTKNISASEQGLQALQLFNIKFGSTDRLLGSGTSGFKSSVESVELTKEISNPRTLGTDEISERLRERLDEQAREAGIYVNVNKLNGGAEDKLSEPSGEEDRSPDFRLRSVNARVSEWDFGEGPIIESLEDSNLLGEAMLELGAGISRLLGAAKIGGEGIGFLGAAKDDKEETEKLLGREELEKSRHGLNSRQKEELRVGGIQLKLDQFARICAQLTANNQNRLENTQALSTLLVEIHLDMNKEEEEDSFINRVYSHNLSKLQKEQVQKALTLVLGVRELRSLFFSPLQGVQPPPPPPPPHHPLQHLIACFDQQNLDEDAFIANTLGMFDDMLDCESIVHGLGVAMYSTFKYIISVDESLRPTLSPIRLEQIDLENVFSCSNFLASYQGLTALDLTRYLGCIQRLNTECAILIIQSQVMNLPPCCLMFVVFQYYEFMLESLHSQGCSSLSSQADIDWFIYLSRAVAVHLPGWVQEWKDILSDQPNLHHFVKDAFASNNLTYLNKYPTIKGSHKSLECLELSPLANFLMDLARLTGPAEQLAWCKRYFFMPGLIRSLLLEKSLATEELPLLVELGDSELLYDVGLMDSENSGALAKHILNIYSKDECPLVWEDFGRHLLRGSGARLTFKLLISLADLMNPGDLSQKFLQDLILLGLESHQVLGLVGHRILGLEGGQV